MYLGCKHSENSIILTVAVFFNTQQPPLHSNAFHSTSISRSLLPNLFTLPPGTTAATVYRLPQLRSNRLPACTNSPTRPHSAEPVPELRYLWQHQKVTHHRTDCHHPRRSDSQQMSTSSMGMRLKVEDACAAATLGK